MRRSTGTSVTHCRSLVHRLSMLRPSSRRAASMASRPARSVCWRPMRPSARSTEATGQRPSAITFMAAPARASRSAGTSSGTGAEAAAAVAAGARRTRAERRSWCADVAFAPASSPPANTALASSRACSGGQDTGGGADWSSAWLEAESDCDTETSTVVLCRVDWSRDSAEHVSCWRSCTGSASLSSSPGREEGMVSPVA